MKTESRKHTHLGTCQACGRAQAYQVNGKVAKHGYTVDWGFFNGVCRGADAKPLEQEKTLTEAIIKLLREQALRHEERAADLRCGIVEPKFTKQIAACHFPRRHEDTMNSRNFHRIDVECSRAELSDYDATQQISAAAYRAESTARHERSHADMLVKLIDARHGQELQLDPRTSSDRKELKAGARVLIGGKKGMICEVIKLENKVCSGCGPYMNGKSMLHAFLKRPDDRVIAIPARTIRQSAIQ